MQDETQTLDHPRSMTKSTSVIKAAKAVMPPTGDAPSSTRNRRHVAPTASFASTQPVLARGKGSVVTDLDGNDYVDFSLGDGAIILGHADERVVAAISKAASKGFGFSDPTEAQVRLAEMLVARFASVEKVLLARSRARAIASAVRVARATTGRKTVLMVRGSVAERVARAADVGFAFFESDRKTRPAGGTDRTHTRLTEPGSPGELEQALREHGPAFAAVVIEPYSVSTGICAPPDGHLNTLRALCSEHGVLLIFDDSVSSLRLGSGGSEGATGVAPDMTCFGAELGSGLPLAALGGRKEVMNKAAKVAGLSTAGDAPTDDLAVAAGIAVLQAVTESGFYENLNERAARLADGFAAACSTSHRSIEVRRVGSLVGVFPTHEGGASLDRNAAVTTALHAYEALLASGIMPSTNPVSPWAVSAAHTVEDLDRAIEAFERVLRSTD